ncbi:competence protein ComEC [Clostridium uliginosum]|uniref:Competence protein ComEC n=2 Tax=Clostridium uliginosum TaxID=119641 RepID=A0A1I1K851_9CLOT|nr:MBL fold metallo-hydrolase [Clostridium uliginosum]SFC56735.1 competence protein ComEC [Clostridium uliginosum]
MKIKFKFLAVFMIILIFSFVGCTNENSKKSIQNSNSNEMLVHFIDVGQGDSMLIQANGKNLLIDSGPKTGKDNLLNYLKSLNISKLDYVIATHPHEDHIGNMADIIKKYDVSNFYAPKVEHTSKTFEKMIESLQSKNLKINVIKKGVDSINLGKGTKVTVFSPTQDSYEELNNYSPVMKIEYGKTSFLFTGDAEKEVEKEILNNNDDIESDVLKLGHHGSSTSTTKNFLKKVNPSLGVICVGNNNTYNHPNKDTISRLKDNNVTIYQTNKEGTIVLSSNGSTITKR